MKVKPDPIEEALRFVRVWELNIKDGTLPTI